MNFINRLSNDEVTEFLKERFPQSKDIFVHVDTFLEPIIHVIITYESDLGDDICYDFILSQFEVRAFPKISEINTKIWHDFLLSQFGDEYDQAFQKNVVMS